MGPCLCALACFKTFTFVGATKMRSCGALFSLAGGGRVKKGNRQICKMAKCKTTTPKAAGSLPKGRRRARFARAKKMENKKGKRKKEIKEKTAAASRERGRRLASPAAGKASGIPYHWLFPPKKREKYKRKKKKETKEKATPGISRETGGF